MLRLTVHDKPVVVTLQLEGELAGALVGELEKCWEKLLSRPPGLIFRLDLTEVTYIDEAGRACLAALHGQGAQFVTADCLMKAIVAEITHQ